MIDSNKIAKNTLFLYFRMILILGVSLYTSRVVLDKLGVDDYALYNVVYGRDKYILDSGREASL